MVRAARVKKLQNVLSANHVDALLITHPPNIFYLCGFTGSSGALLINERESVFFSDGRYKTQAAQEVKGPRIVIAAKAALNLAADWIVRNRSRFPPLASLGIESEHMSFATRKRLKKAIGSTIRLAEPPALVEKLRMIKDAGEIVSIRKAAHLGASLLGSILKVLRPGVKESEVAAEMEYAARRAGATQMSFPTIIAAGKRSALPHGRASDFRVPARGFVVCDFGVILANYCSDMTRTLHVGHASGAARRGYEAVREAQQAAVGAVCAGVTAGEVDQAARRVLAKAGLSKYFTHSTGHGVGIEIHEAPRVAARQEEVLQAGMVITIEPGIYIPGKWGVRIEDMVVVTESGCDILAPTDTELVEL